MITLLKNAKVSAREIGVFATLLFALSKLIRLLGSDCGLYYYLFVRQGIPKLSITPQNKGKSFEFRILNENHPILTTLPRPSGIIKERFACGYICILATKNNNLAGCVWLCLRDYIEDEVRSIYIPLPRGEVAWDFDVYIDPKYRFGYLFSKLWDEANSYLKNNGCKATISRISGFNSRSIYSHKRLGAEIIGKAIYIKVNSIQISLSSIYPYFHLSPDSKSIPHYELR